VRGHMAKNSGGCGTTNVEGSMEWCYAGTFNWAKNGSFAGGSVNGDHEKKPIEEPCWLLNGLIFSTRRSMDGA